MRVHLYSFCLDDFHSHSLSISLLNCRALLSLWIEPVHLRTLIVDQDPSTTEEEQKQALVRALHSRVSLRSAVVDGAAEKPVSEIRAPAVLIAPADGAFRHGKAAAKYAHPIMGITTEPEGEKGEEGTGPSSNKRRKRNPLSPCGASLNWYLSSPATHSTLNTTSTVPSVDPSRPSKPRKIAEMAGGTVEVTIAHTGALQGSVKKSVGEVSSASRLSPHAMRTLFEHTLQVLQRHRLDSEQHKQVFSYVADLFVSVPHVTPSSVAEALGDGASTATTATTANQQDTNNNSTTSLLTQVQQLSRRELKKRCGRCYYNSAKAQFLCHPVFKDWICDE